MTLFRELLSAIERAEPCVWVTVSEVRGSAPREVGAGMLVTANSLYGTIGGGHLEQKALELARERLHLAQSSATRRHYPLGPALGQCCGGAVDLLFRPLDASAAPWVAALSAAERIGGEVVLSTLLDAGAGHTTLGDAAAVGAAVTRHTFNPWRVWVFGAGHVGRALAQVFGSLPCDFTWVDSRDEQYPARVSANVIVLQSDHPADEVRAISPGADVLVLTHSHVLDMEIVRALLARDDLGYVGMIGSATKAALFRRRLGARGVPAHAIARLTCPIGSPLAGDKHPGSIAVGVAAELLLRRRSGATSHLPHVVDET